MDTLPTEDSNMKSAELIFKRKRGRARQKANRKERQQRLDQMLQNIEAPKSEESSVEDVANLENSNAQLLPLGHLEIQTESTTTSLEKSPIKKKNRKRRSRKKALNKKVDPCSMDQNSASLKNEESSITDVANLENSNAQLLPLGHLELQTESTATLLEKSSIKKKNRKKRSGKKALNKKADPCSMDQNSVPSNPSLLDSKHGEVENVLLNPNISIEDVVSSENCEAQLLPPGHLATQTEATTNLLEKSPVKKKKRKRRSVMKTLNNSGLIVHGHSAPKEPGDFCITGGPRLRRKLLILDVNGLLADVVNPPPKDCNPDACFARRAIFKRPYCNDFLKFCFDRFDVGIWSSRSKKIIVKVVDYLLGNMKHKLLFCWDMSHSTQTMFKTLENKHKPLVCKELRKVWDRYDPNLPWERGDYDESNTLLLDDSPYKALLNPVSFTPPSFWFQDYASNDPLGLGISLSDCNYIMHDLLPQVHTAIFPHSYNYKSENDNSLGPGGDLRIYLEELLKAEHVQKYIEQHPFGQRAIDQTSSDWKFYSDVLCSLLDQQATDQTSSQELLKA